MQNQVVPTTPSQTHWCNRGFHHAQKHRGLQFRVLLSTHKTGPHSNAWLSRPTLLTLPGSLNSLLIHLTSCEYICSPISYLFTYDVILLECHFSTPQVNKPCSSPVWVPGCLWMASRSTIFPLPTPVALVVSLRQFGISLFEVPAPVELCFSGGSRQVNCQLPVTVRSSRTQDAEGRGAEAAYQPETVLLKLVARYMRNLSVTII